jgi:hypothetical protein
MFFLKSKYIFVKLSLIFLVFSLGCATSQVKLVDVGYTQDGGRSHWPDKTLEKQFRTYWAQRFTGSLEAGYAMENPYFREMVPFGKYRTFYQNAFKSRLLKMEIQRIEQVSDYLVKIDCTASIQSGDDKPADVMLADRWVYVDQKWWHVVRDPTFAL